MGGWVGRSGGSGASRFVRWDEMGWGELWRIGWVRGKQRHGEKKRIGVVVR